MGGCVGRYEVDHVEEGDRHTPHPPSSLVLHIFVFPYIYLQGPIALSISFTTFDYLKRYLNVPKTPGAR